MGSAAPEGGEEEHEDGEDFETAGEHQQGEEPEAAVGDEHEGAAVAGDGGAEAYVGYA